jgi:hypothetical protein
MKRLAFILIVSIGTFINLSFINSAEDAVLGYWYVEAFEESHIKVMKSKSGSYFGKITSSSQELLVGKVILKNMTYHSDGGYWEGRLLPPNRFFEVDAKFYLDQPDTLRVKGNILFISKTFLWVRVEE